MREWQSQSHVKWYCRSHMVIIAKCRQRSMFKALRKDMGEVLKEMCRRFGVELVEGHVMPDHVYMCLSIPPKFSVANTIWKLKGKSVIYLHQRYILDFGQIAFCQKREQGLENQKQTGF